MSTRFFLRNTQTVSGTGGTIYDLSTVQGTSANLVSASITGTAFVKVFEFRTEIGSTFPQTAIPTSVVIAAVSASTMQCQWRVVQIRSGSVIASSAYRAVINAAGTYTGTLDLTAEWATGDFLAIEFEVRRVSGGGGRTATISVNNANTWIEPTLVAPPDAVTGTGAAVAPSLSLASPTAAASGEFTAPSGGGGPAEVQYLIVAGGGGGGSGVFARSAGGGGAGGLLTGTTEITETGTFPIVVGGGGTGGVAGFGNANMGVNGGNSSFNSLVAVGGGGGAGGPDFNQPASANSGGSGGGGYDTAAAGAGTSGQGNAGGTVGDANPNDGAGGGGGAGGVGGDGVAATLGGGAGGPGVSSSITGSAVTYAGGGGGSRLGAGGTGGGGTGGNLAVAPTDGAANTGGGGGGARDLAGGNGGSGIVIIRYATADLTATGGSITTVGDDTVHTFTSSGDFVVTAIAGGGDPDPVTGTGAAVAPALTLAAPVAAGSGAYSVAGVTGTAAAVAPALTLDAPVAAGSGAYSIPAVTGTGAAVAPALTLAPPVASASGALVSGLSGVTFTATKVGVNEAPQSVQFAATATGVADQSEVVFLWDFDDDYEFRYLPNDTKSNDRQSGTAIGFRAAHVYRAAGTYTVRCTAYQFDGGTITSVTTTQDVTIDAADSAITSRVAISRTGNFTGAPAGASQQTWDGTEGNFTFQPNTAYYFEAGQTFTRGLNAANFTGGGVLKLHRYGTGANPIIERNLIVWGSNHGNTSVCEVEFLGPFDVNNDPNWEDTDVYPTPPPAPPETGIFILPANGGQTTLIYGTKVSGFQINIYPINANASSITHVMDCESTNWFDYGCLDSNQGPIAYVGCYFHQKIGTQPLPAQSLTSRAWNTVGAMNTARQGAIRITDSPDVIINKSNFLSYRSGWSPGFGGFAAIQAAARVGTNAVTGTENASVAQNDFVGGFNVLTLAVQNTSTAQAAVGTYVAEANYIGLDLDGDSTDVVPVSKAGAHIRGNIVHYPAGITHRGFTNINLVFGAGASSFAANATTRVYGNTLASDNADNLTWQTQTQITAGTRPITYENNLFQLRGTSNVGGSGALFQTDYEPIQAAFPFAPLEGSVAFEGYTTGRLPALSQDGALRVAPFSIGASEEAETITPVTGTGAAAAPLLSLAAPIALAAGTFALAAVNGVGAAVAPPLTLAQPVAAASGAYAVDPVTGTASAVAPTLTLAQPIAGASGAYAVDAVAGTGAAIAPPITLAQPTAASSGAFAVDAVTGTAAAIAPVLTLAQPVATASGAYVVEGITGTATAVAPALSLSQPVASASGDFTSVSITGVGVAIAPTLNLAAPVAASGGQFVAAVVTGTAAAVAPTLTLAAPVADGSAVNVGPVAGIGAAVAPSLNLASPVATSSGSFTLAGVIGAGSGIAPPLTLAQPEASGAGGYAEFVQITPNIAFKVPAQPRSFAVPSQSRVFRVLKGTL